MAKDGTARGGLRVGAGRKPKALADKVAQGTAADIPALPAPADMEGVDVPPVKDFLKAAQKSGIDLCAEDVFRSTYTWLEEHGCGQFVNPQLIEQYAMSVSRWVQCETCINEPVCDDEPELFEAGQPVLVPDIPDREGELLCRVWRSEPTR